MKPSLICCTFLALSFVVVACGDDGDSATRPSDESSSSVALSSSSSFAVIPGLTGNLLTDSRDGQTYKTVTIGTQTWMAENLNFKTANSYCYNDSAEYCSKYGRLYTWAAAMEACPAGWHLPTEAEFKALINAIGGESVAGTKLKSTSGWYNSGNGISGSDDFFFSALPAGNRDGNGDFYHEGYEASFWSSTEFYSDGVIYMNLDYDNCYAYLKGFDKNNGLSVRCVMD